MVRPQRSEMVVAGLIFLTESFADASTMEPKVELLTGLSRSPFSLPGVPVSPGSSAPPSYSLCYVVDPVIATCTFTHTGLNRVRFLVGRSRCLSQRASWLLEGIQGAMESPFLAAHLSVFDSSHFLERPTGPKGGVFGRRDPGQGNSR